MKVAQLPFEKTGFFSKTMLDYLAKKESIKPFYHNYPDLVGFRNQLEEKEKSFNLEPRNVLSKSLEKQYQGFDLSEATQNNIKLLKQKNTFTVTTGHQLNLFTGPLYWSLLGSIRFTGQVTPREIAKVPHQEIGKTFQLLAHFETLCVLEPRRSGTQHCCISGYDASSRR